MSVEGYTRNPSRLTRHLLTTQWSSDTIAQIYWWNHDNLLQTACDLDNKYWASFSGIELNIGCPSPKIMSCEAWSGMLKCRPKTLQIIQKISQSIKKPFSIKTRSGLTEYDEQEQFDFIIESAYHCHMITIHGRTYKQSHSGSVNRDFIMRVKQELIKRNLPHVKIIWNGWLKSAVDSLSYITDVTSYQLPVASASSAIQTGNRKPETGNHRLLDGIMLGQAAMCNPRSLVNYTPDAQELYETTLKHLHQNLANERYFSHADTFNQTSSVLNQPTNNQLAEITSQIENWELQAENWKWHSLIEFRKHLFWYVSGLPNSSEFKRGAAIITDYKELLDHIHTYFQPIISWNLSPNTSKDSSE